MPTAKSVPSITPHCFAQTESFFLQREIGHNAAESFAIQMYGRWNASSNWNRFLTSSQIMVWWRFCYAADKNPSRAGFRIEGDHERVCRGCSQLSKLRRGPIRSALQRSPACIPVRAIVGCHQDSCPGDDFFSHDATSNLTAYSAQKSEQLWLSTGQTTRPPQLEHLWSCADTNKVGP